MNFKEIISQNSNPVIVFGASVMGKFILDVLEILNVKIICFCDNDIGKQNGLFHGYNVISFDRLCSKYSNANIIIAAERYFNEIKKQLLDEGFSDTFCIDDIIECIDYDKIPEKKLQNIAWHLAKFGKLSEISNFNSGGLHIKRLNVVATTRCTLKCEHCSSLMPYYKKQYDVDTWKILSSLDRIFSCVDLIYHVELIGGEPLLYKNLPEITHHLIDSGKVLHIDVITNGTIIPSEKILESLNHDIVSVVIDDYGKLSKKKQSLSKMLSQFGIDFRINKHWAWADLGGFESRGLLNEELAEVFSICNFNDCTELLDGRLHRCPRSSHGMNIGFVPVYKDDFINILDFKIKENQLKEKLNSFFHDKKFIHACNHCDGNTSDTLILDIAEQSGRKPSRHEAIAERPSTVI